MSIATLLVGVVDYTTEVATNVEFKIGFFVYPSKSRQAPNLKG